MIVPLDFIASIAFEMILEKTTWSFKGSQIISESFLGFSIITVSEINILLIESLTISDIEIKQGCEILLEVLNRQSSS